ncbi:uncharacterized protein N7484_006378 [Penicillium longicatenatum]|uniref:uncharacterized protein n=1 Tax=Penicillium longicatenatum TaxID=1561947 RepID=UPI0025474B0D|nr:uncharacterized protein N7484_006378 [Penicillium longicatenatum]KAJ5643871.1 hypothetical protein N7484_006378 [Penicillium longicatenatum]
MVYLLLLPFIGLSDAKDTDVESIPVWSSHEPIHLARYSLLSLSCTAFAYLIWQLFFRYYNHLRQLSTFGHDNQRYFETPTNEVLAWLKEHLIYAPLFKVRHNREFRGWKNIHMGTLPSRFHSLLILGMLSLNFGLCLVNVPYQNRDSTAKAIRKSTGTVATANLIPLVLMAGRHNPLIRALRVPFDTWMLLHRWLGRIVVLESLVHTMTWGISYAEAENWRTVAAALVGGSFLRDGFVATCILTVILLQSPSPIRHAFYETFLHLHFVLAALTMAFLWVHLDGMHSQNYLFTAIILWISERTVRIVILIYRNYGPNSTMANVEILHGDAMRITLRLARPWTFKPGQHLYLYIPAVGWWTSHPFSIAWSENTHSDEEGLPSSEDDLLGNRQSTISLLVQRRAGMTDHLFRKASKGSTTYRALTEGPYGNIHSLDSYGTVLLFAGGLGIAHQISFVRHLVSGFAEGTLATRRIFLVWVVRSSAHLEWVRSWITSILEMDRQRDILRIMLFITQPQSTKEIQECSMTIPIFPGRPNVETLIDMEIGSQIGAMGVMVCGSGSLSDDVRHVCRRRQAASNIDFIEESFSW